MKGFDALDATFTSGIAAMADTKFSHTDYSFSSLIPVCQAVSERIIIRSGGTVTDDGYTFTRQKPLPPMTFEQWPDQVEAMKTPIAQSELAWWDPKWRVIACGTDMAPGVRSEALGRENVLVLHPVSESSPAVISARIDVPSTGKPELIIETASDPKGDYVLKVFIDGALSLERKIDTQGEWQKERIDLTPLAGRSIDVRIENHANGWSFEAGYFASAGVEGN